MTKYEYTGQALTCLSLETGEVALPPGAVVELPDVPVVATLVARGLLVPVAEAIKPIDGAPTRPAKSTKTGD